MASKTKAVITGGGGYFGNRLALRLQDAGYHVVALDLKPHPTSEVETCTGDVRDLSTLLTAFQNADIVFHVASYGMSMREQLQDDIIYDVNVNGTQNVLAACVVCGVPRVVYTSTYNTVFGGQEIVAGDETTPYFPPARHCDAYSRTKTLAEMAVLAADGRALARPNAASGASTLHTTALRPAGIYGAGETRHLPRTVASARRGLYKFTFGPDSALVDMVHVDNLVQAHFLAAEVLKSPQDDRPVNMFEFYRPMLEGLGFPAPRLKLPLQLVYFMAWLTEVVWRAVHHIWDFQPFILRAEVLKVGVTHYFVMDKACKDLGYAPVASDLVSCGALEWFLRRLPEDRQRQSSAWKILLGIAIIFACIALALRL